MYYDESGTFCGKDTVALILSTSGLITSARLKAVGVESVVVDRLARPGDNWALRYDSLRFHIAKSSCHPPFLREAILQNTEYTLRISSIF